MPYARLLQVAELAAKKEREEWRKLAFIGWQFHGGSFAEYLDALGLGEREALPEVSVEEALAKSESVLARLQEAQRDGRLERVHAS